MLQLLHILLRSRLLLFAAGCTEHCTAAAAPHTLCLIQDPIWNNNILHFIPPTCFVCYLAMRSWSLSAGMKPALLVSRAVKASLAWSRGEGGLTSAWHRENTTVR